MKKSYAPNLYLALIHHPVVNKNGETITSAVTNLDLHDIARAARTYGVRRFYVVTPLADQKVLVKRIVAHWTVGVGGNQNPKRREALSLIHVKDSLDQAIDHIQKHTGQKPRVVATSARARESSISFDQCRKMVEQDSGCLIVFGTAWGLADPLLEKADGVLESVRGFDRYNHLSVRSATAIILDRLCKLS